MKHGESQYGIVHDVSGRHFPGTCGSLRFAKLLTDELFVGMKNSKSPMMPLTDPQNGIFAEILLKNRIFFSTGETSKSLQHALYDSSKEALLPRPFFLIIFHNIYTIFRSKNTTKPLIGVWGTLFRETYVGGQMKNCLKLPPNENHFLDRF